MRANAPTHKRIGRLIAFPSAAACRLQAPGMPVDGNHDKAKHASLDVCYSDCIDFQSERQPIVDTSSVLIWRLKTLFLQSYQTCRATLSQPLHNLQGSIPLPQVLHDAECCKLGTFPLVTTTRQRGRVAAVAGCNDWALKCCGRRYQKDIKYHNLYIVKSSEDHKKYEKQKKLIHVDYSSTVYSIGSLACCPTWAFFLLSKKRLKTSVLKPID